YGMNESFKGAAGLDDFAQALREVVQAGRALEGLVHAVAQEDDVGLDVGQVLVDVAEVERPWLEVDLIGRVAEVAERQAEVGPAHLKESFDVAELAGALGESVAEEDDAVALLEGELRCGGLGGGDGGGEEGERDGGAVRQVSHAG